MDGNALAPYFYRGLKDVIKDLLVGQKEWRTFEELQERASRLDARLQVRKIEKEQDTRARAAPPPLKTETKPAFNPKPAFVKGGVRMMEIRWMNSDVNGPSGVDERRRRR